MKVLITFAVDTEFAPWKRTHRLRCSSRNGITFYRAWIAGIDVDFVVTGMGAVNAGCAGVLMREVYDFVIASGFAGGLRPGINAGDVVVARSVQQFDKPKSISCAPDLVVKAASVGATVIETLLSVEHVAATPDDKAHFAPFAEVADMESFAVLSAAEAHGIPAVAIRAISDTIDHELPEGIDTVVTPAGHVSVSEVAKYVARHPGAVREVIRLGIRSRSAAETLARFLDSFLQALSPVAPPSDPNQLHGVAAR
jgi:adenosylhomocysteine nucleosidase